MVGGMIVEGEDLGSSGLKMFVIFYDKIGTNCLLMFLLVNSKVLILQTKIFFLFIYCRISCPDDINLQNHTYFKK